jgi:hypothetical protein
LPEYSKSIFNFYSLKTVFNMKNKELYKLLKKNKSNSGFTLTELLVGLFMSIFVIGALGFGLMTVLATSQSETSKVKARTENSRALDFISDEVRQARTIETNATNAPRFTISDATVVLALDIPIISNSATLDTDSDADTKNERIVYYLKSTDLGNWKGPQVLYRWGPPLNANGEYSPKTGGTTNHWTAQALLDGINNTTVSSPCATGTVTPATPTGFYACITGTNTAQLFLTGQTKTASGRYDDTQTNDSQVVARAREALAYKTDINNSVTWSFKDIGGPYNCKAGTAWSMRTNFGTNTADLNASTTPWNRDETKQPQPIGIDTSKPLVITSTPVGGASDCTSRGNQGTGTLDLNASTTVKVSHAIDFGKPMTFNGDCNSSLGDCSSYNNKPRVKGDLDQTVQFLKKGYQIPTRNDNSNYGGYDADSDGVFEPGDGDQPSLGRYLYDQGMAIINPSNTTLDDSNTTVDERLNNPLTKFLIPTDNQLAESSLTVTQKSAFKLLRNDQRIIAFEVGQTDPNHPGFDLQDNIFVVTSDVFNKKFDPNTCFDSDGC